MHHLMKYSYIYLIPLFFSAVFSLKFFRLNAPKQLKIFSIFIWTTLVAEVFSISWKWGLCQTKYWHYTPSNLWIYNAFIPLRHILLLWFLFNIISLPVIRKTIKISAIPFIFFALFDYTWIQTPHTVNSYSIILGNIITVFFLLTFFYLVLKENTTALLSVKWLCGASLLYYSVSLPVFIFLNYFIGRDISIASKIFYINDTLNILMYSSYLIAFICHRPLVKQPSSL
jgi:hypothetical protein